MATGAALNAAVSGAWMPHSIQRTRIETRQTGPPGDRESGPSPEVSVRGTGTCGTDSPLSDLHGCSGDGSHRLAEVSSGGLTGKAGDAMADTHSKTVAFELLKGGVGKSTATVNVAAEAARLGLRVLVVDADVNPAASAMLCRVDPGTDLVDTLSTVITPDARNRVPVSDAIRPAWSAWQPDPALSWGRGGALDPAAPGVLHVLPSDPSVSAVAALSTMPMKVLHKALHGSSDYDGLPEDAYDLIIIDAAAGDTPALMAMIAAGWVVLIGQPEAMAYNAVLNTYSTAIRLGEDFDTVVIGGVILARSDLRRLDHREYTARLQQWAADNLTRIDGNNVIGAVWAPSVPSAAVAASQSSRQEPVVAGLRRAHNDGDRLAALSASRTYPRLIATFTQLALNTISLTDPDRAEQLATALDGQDMPKEMHEALITARAAAENNVIRPATEPAAEERSNA